MFWLGIPAPPKVLGVRCLKQNIVNPDFGAILKKGGRWYQLCLAGLGGLRGLLRGCPRGHAEVANQEQTCEPWRVSDWVSDLCCGFSSTQHRSPITSPFRFKTVLLLESHSLSASRAFVTARGEYCEYFSSWERNKTKQNKLRWGIAMLVGHCYAGGVLCMLWGRGSAVSLAYNGRNDGWYHKHLVPAHEGLHKGGLCASDETAHGS